MARNQTCLSCRYFEPELDDPELQAGAGNGTCRAHTPSPGQGWPPTHQSEWCGEHAPQEPQREAD